MCHWISPLIKELSIVDELCLWHAGDIHGQYSDLLRLFEYGGFPPHANYLFLGDYVDRGKQSLETICLLLAYKIKYPENFFLLRGNHECASINRIYGFYDECKRRFNVRLWKTFTECFNCLPVAALIDEKILCMHGGLSPELNHLDQIRNLQRPTDVPDTGLLCDLLWSDPSKDVQGWGMNDRGVSYTFGPDKVTEFLQKQDLDLICRAHQVWPVTAIHFLLGRLLVEFISFTLLLVGLLQINNLEPSFVELFTSFWELYLLLEWLLSQLATTVLTQENILQNFPDKFLNSTVVLGLVVHSMQTLSFYWNLLFPNVCCRSWRMDMSSSRTDNL